MFYLLAFFPFFILFLFSFILIFLSFGVEASIHATCKTNGFVVLTFDQGPSILTSRLLDTLNELKVHAVFHIQPENLRNTTNVEYIRRASLEGHSIGIFLPDMNKSGLEEEDYANAGQMFMSLTRSANWITSVTGQPVKYVRIGMSKSRNLPSQIRKAIESLGFVITKAKIEIRDESNRMDSIWSSLGKGMAGASIENNSFIIRQREFMSNSISSVERIIEYIREKGFKIVSMEQCIPFTIPQALNADKKKK